LQVAVRGSGRRGVGTLLVSRVQTTRLRALLVALAIVAGTFLVYTANGETLTSFDTAPNSLLPLNLLERRRLDLDAFRDGTIAAAGGAYAFTAGVDGHLTSVFPIGTALVSLPIYTAFALVRHDDAHAHVTVV
jgi:hypothetical protein